MNGDAQVSRCRLRPGTAAALAVALTAGCAVGPDYVKPELATPTGWSASADGVHAASPELAAWWKGFGDPVLEAVVERVLASNSDLNLAGAKLREVRASREMTTSAERPRIDAQGSVRRLRDNKPPAPPEGVVGSWFQTGFDAGWEVDLFGGVRRAAEAADAEVGAAAEDRGAVRVSILGEAARTYVEVRGLQRRLALTARSVSAERETLELIEGRLRAGLASEFDADRARAHLAATEAQVPALEATLGRAVHRLGVLAGEGPGALAELLGTEGPIPTPRADVGIGLPSELLSRRPDLRRAERELAAATARVGVATADLYPRFSITGSFGFQSGHFRDFSDWSARIWSVGPSFRWPIFDAGRVRANVRVQDARLEQARLRYEKALLAALEEVESALLSYGKEEDRRRSLEEAVGATERAARTASALYASGLADFLSVLDAQRSLYAAEQEATTSQAAASSQLVALYKALGGGWQSAGVEP